MQFKQEQLQQLSRSWGPESWFYEVLGPPAREIIERAYGIRHCAARERSKSQEYLTLALSLFARKVGADKAQVVHALLTGKVESLLAAMGRKPGAIFSIDEVEQAFQSSFREVGVA